MRKLASLAVVLICYVGYGIFISQYNFLVLPEALQPDHPSGYHDYHGSTHAHTTLSTGSGTPEEVAHEANQAGLDFLFLTDLNPFGQTLGPIGYTDKVLSFRAGEFSYLDSRLLFYDISKKHRFKTLGQAQVFFADLLFQDKDEPEQGFLVLAHPFKRGFNWSGDLPPGMKGIELINLKKIWEQSWQHSKLSFLWSALIYPFSPQLALLRLYQDPKDELHLLDSFQQTRVLGAFAGNDATAKPIQIGQWIWQFPTYKTSFDIASNHVLLQSELTGDSRSDGEKIFRALKDGAFYMSVDLLGDPTGFFAEMRDSKNRYTMGSTLSLKPDLKLIVHLPRKPRVPYEVAVIKDGNHYMSSNAQDTMIAIPNPGVYRVLVRVIPTLPLPDGKRWLSWIYTNSFYVR